MILTKFIIQVGDVYLQRLYGDPNYSHRLVRKLERATKYETKPAARTALYESGYNKKGTIVKVKETVPDPDPEPTDTALEVPEIEVQTVTPENQPAA